MLKRALQELPEHLYPTDPWRIVETAWSDRHFQRAETIFALSNGYIGVRGTPDECRPAQSPGVYVNGFHETWPLVYAEHAYGLAKMGQTIVNVPDAMVVQLFVDDEPLHVPVANFRSYSRVLDMGAGTLVRELEWSTPAGRHVAICSTRLVSLAERHLMAVSYEVLVRDHPAPVVLKSSVVRHTRLNDHLSGPVDPRVTRELGKRVLNVVAHEWDGERLLVGYRTANSGMTLGLGVDYVVETAAAHETRGTFDEQESELVVTIDAEPGVPIRLTKFISYQSSRSADPRDLIARCGRTLSRARRGGFDALQQSQRAELKRFWDNADVRVDAPGEPRRLQQAVRWNLFQLCQATWRAEGSGVPAKGLTGSGYEGHYFWDTELCVLPFLAVTQPRIARNLLRFRHTMLPAARDRARELHLRGALFPWRTINGQEASGSYESGTAQYHLNADIAYAIRQYVQSRGDNDFLLEVGAEILVETARLWEDLGFYGADGGFHIHGVTGPDEYTTVVNDNTYTNLLARINLQYAVATLRDLERERPEAYAGLVDDLELAPDEVGRWEKAAAAMHIPYDAERGIHPQDEHFLEREVWDLDATPAEDFPLLLHFHPLTIYRHQVLKQADVVLAMLLLNEEFPLEQKRANFEYYDKLTTGDSSLSASVQSMVAADIGEEERAREYFRFALLTDLADVGGNASDGVHVAAAGGVWLALVRGFGGVRIVDGKPSINPQLPAAWRSLEFSLRWHGSQLRLQLGHDEERYVLESGEPVELTIRGEQRRLEPGQPLRLSPRSEEPVA